MYRRPYGGALVADRVEQLPRRFLAHARHEVTDLRGAGSPLHQLAVGQLVLLDVRQQGQVALSALWGTVGFAALVLGLRRDLRLVRLGALTLLLVTVGKVFLFDLATLTSIYRVMSFIGLGMFLLTGAFVWQRLRPRDVPDMREVPEGIR